MLAMVLIKAFYMRLDGNKDFRAELIGERLCSVLFAVPMPDRTSVHIECGKHSP
jgi:hypothetical protein